MKSRVAKLAFDPLAVAAEALCQQEIAPVPELPDTPAVKHLLRKFRSDENLARDIKAGEADALTELYQRHCRLVFNVARRILHGDGDAEDVVQQVFLDVYRSIHRFSPEKGSFKTWLLMFAYQRTLNHRRSLTAARYFSSDSIDDSIAASAVPHAGYSCKAQEARILTRQILASLPERERRTIELVYYDGLTAVEVSRCTGETVRVVRHNLYRGLEKLRRFMCE